MNRLKLILNLIVDFSGNTEAQILFKRVCFEAKGFLLMKNLKVEKG
ncbi:hypothetical protein [Chryseobacterium artocarpi]